MLRKKNNQVTFLHVYHHTLMAAGGFVYIKLFHGGGQPTLLGILNSFVHVVMYSYYFLTSYKPGLKNILWFKRHITELQMIQFAILFLHLTIPFLTECQFSRTIAGFFMGQNIFMLFLFGDFYFRTYIMKKVKN